MVSLFFWKGMLMMNSDISIIMPVYNGETYLAESIESILNQTYVNYEFLIINDGSTDNSMAIISEYARKDDRIVIISRENKGLVASLNEGIALAKGKYIARMDADDISLPHRMEKQWCYLRENPDVDILGSYLEIIGDIDEVRKENYIKVFNCSLTVNNVEEKMLEGCAIPHPSAMINKRLFNHLQYRDTYKCAEDYDLWMRALKQGFKIRKLEQVLLKYRVHTASKSYNEKKNMHQFFDVVNIKLDYIEGKYISQTVKVIIWGASNAGLIVNHVLKTRDYYEIVGFIDKYKSGVIEGLNIYKPDQLEDLDFDYIFIASNPGKEEIIGFLKAKGMNLGENFFYIL